MGSIGAPDGGPVRFKGSRVHTRAHHTQRRCRPVVQHLRCLNNRTQPTRPRRLHLRHLLQHRQVLRFLAIGAFVHQDEVGMRCYQLVLQCQCFLAGFVGGVQQALGRAQAGQHTFFVPHQLFCLAAVLMAVQRPLLCGCGLGSAAQLRPLVNGVALGHFARAGRCKHLPGIGDQLARDGARMAHALQQAGHGLLHALLGCDHLTRAATDLGQLAQQTLGGRAAHAQCKHPVARLARCGHDALDAPHFAVGDQQNAGGAHGLLVFGGDADHRLQGPVHFGAAQIGLDAAGLGTQAALVRLGAPLQARQHMQRLAAKAGQRHFVIGLQLVKQPVQRVARLRDAVALHRARAIHQHLHAQRRCGCAGCVPMRHSAAQHGELTRLGRVGAGHGQGRVFEAVQRQHKVAV